MFKNRRIEVQLKDTCLVSILKKTYPKIDSIVKSNEKIMKPRS